MITRERGCFIELKTAYEMSCHQFKESIRAYIDQELPINEKSVFLDHAENCIQCREELHSMQFVTTQLKQLKRITVSPEFDFRIKNNIRREHERLRNPFYSARIFFRENMLPFLTIPAVAACLIVGMLVYSNVNSPITSDLPQSVMVQFDSQKGVDLIDDAEPTQVVDEQYVLDTVTPQDLQNGLFLIENGSFIPVNRETRNLTLVNF